MLMDDKLLAVLAGAVAGAAGYWITTFWMKPILQYRELRSKVAADFIFYAQVVNADGLSDRMKELYEERIVANRRNSAELAACLPDLPLWYSWFLRCRGQVPARAAKTLIGFSNTKEYDMAAKQVSAIRRDLRIRTDIE
jgi:hypothetical protein